MRILLAFVPAVGANPESYPHFQEWVSGVWHGPARRQEPNHLLQRRAATIVGASTILAGGTDYIAVLGEVLPSTNGNSRQATDMVILLATLTALTALAGTQLLRRA